MEDEDLAAEFGANGTVEPDVQIESQAETQPEPVAQETSRQEHNDGGRVPLSELLSERKERQELQRKLNEFLQQQKKPEEQAKPDFWAEPEDHVRQQASDITRQALDPVQQSLSFNNRLIAGSVLGKDAVDAAEQAFNKAIEDGKMDPATHARINNHPNPFHAAVEWHKQQQVLEKTGGDLTAYEQRLLEEKLKDPEFLAKAVAAHQSAQQQTRNVTTGQFGTKPTTIIRPPSLNRATGSSNASAGETTDDDLAADFGAR